jgi:predicted GNAT superfamily acetyltransferase
VAVDAAICAQIAADKHGLRIVQLEEIDEHEALADLLARIWRAESADQMITTDMLRALAHSGNYVVGAYRDGVLVGAIVAFLGIGHVHSHIAGVAPGQQGHGIGYALKQHQRAWALANGYTEVRWTFDPLVRRNAYFNLHKLGALPAEYLPEFYGTLKDGITAGDKSDRLYVRWRLASGRATAAARGEYTQVDATRLRTSDVPVLLDRVRGEPRLVGRLESHPTGPHPTAAPATPMAPPPAARPPMAPPHDGRPSALVAVPLDIEELRARDPGSANRWRYAVREALVGALAAGYEITGISKDGFYLLTPGS